MRKDNETLHLEGLLVLLKVKWLGFEIWGPTRVPKKNQKNVISCMFLRCKKIRFQTLDNGITRRLYFEIEYSQALRLLVIYIYNCYFLAT